jgi:hypothetical protein
MRCEPASVHPADPLALTVGRNAPYAARSPHAATPRSFSVLRNVGLFRRANSMASSRVRRSGRTCAPAAPGTNPTAAAANPAATTPARNRARKLY